MNTGSKIKGERGKWTEYWTPADKVHDALATLRIKIPDFDANCVRSLLLRYEGKTIHKFHVEVI